LGRLLWYEREGECCGSLGRSAAVVSKGGGLLKSYEEDALVVLRGGGLLWSHGTSSAAVVREQGLWFSGEECSCGIKVKKDCFGPMVRRADIIKGGGQL
jgi:hypothetical protein